MSCRNDYPATCAMLCEDDFEKIQRSRIDPDRGFVQKPQRRTNKQQSTQCELSSLAGRQHARRKCRISGQTKGVERLIYISAPDFRSEGQILSCVRPALMASRCPT